MKFLFDNVEVVILVIILVVLLVNLRNIIGKRVGFFKDNSNNNVAGSAPSTTKPSITKPSNANKLTDTTKQPASGKEKNSQERLAELLQKELDNIEKQKQDTLVNKPTYPQGSLLHTLQTIEEKDPTFNSNTFIENSKTNFVTIVTNFNLGKLEDLKSLVSSKVLTAFENAIIAENFASKNIVVSQFLSVMYTFASITENTATVDIKFTTQQNINGVDNIVAETWSFTKDITTSNNWLLSKIKV